MKCLPWIAASLCLALAGCGASMDQLSKAADSTRSAAERIAEASSEASNAREDKILADARDIEATQAALAGMDTGERPRYEIRKDQDSWMVYDTANNRPARIGTKSEAGISHDDAQAAFDSLMAEEKRTQEQFTPSGEMTGPALPIPSPPN